MKRDNYLYYNKNFSTSQYKINIKNRNEHLHLTFVLREIAGSCIQTHVSSVKAKNKTQNKSTHANFLKKTGFKCKFSPKIKSFRF